MRLWKDILATIESMVVPPLSDQPTEMKPLNEREIDTVYKWLKVSSLPCPNFFVADVCVRSS